MALEQVPNDILCPIFESTHDLAYYSQPPECDASRGPTHQGTRAVEIEIALSRVCKLWRDLVHTLPGLWVTFRFRAAASVSGDGLAEELERLHLYLARSIDKDLDLVFDFVGIQEEMPLLMDMLHLVTPHLRRLWRFVLHSDSTNFVVPFHKDLTDVGAPRLEHFEVCTGKYHNIEEEGYDGKPHWDPKILTRGPPNIKFLKLDSSASGRFRPPFDNLVHFSLHPGHAPIQLQLLWVCFEQIISLPFIETISIWNFVIAPPGPGGRLRTIEAKRLKHFRVGKATDRFSPLAYLLRGVTAPALESLTIQQSALGMDFSAWHQVEVEEMGPHLQFPSLRSLYLVDVYAPRYLNDSLVSFWEVFYAKSATATHLSVSYIVESFAPELSIPDISVWGSILSKREGGVIPRDGGQLPWRNVQLLEVNHDDGVERVFGDSMAHFRPLGLWPNLSTIRTPFGRLPRCFEPSNVSVEPLRRIVPDWPPNYPLSSGILTDEFPCRLRVSSSVD